MSSHDSIPSPDEETDPLQDVIRYAPGLVAIVLTVGVSLMDHLPWSRPPLVQTVLIAAVPATILAYLVHRSKRDPSGSQFLVLTLFAWVVFSVARLPFLDRHSTLVDGSLYVLADLGLVWLGSYLFAGAVVYGVDWPTPHVARDPEVDPADPDFADD